MSEHQSRRIPLELIQTVQQDLERRGYYFFPVEKEHTEALITAPLAQRLRTQIKKRGFGKVAGRVILTFSGYDDDPREIFEVPEIRSYFRQLDAELPELPALMAHLAAVGFNGPGIYLELLGEVDAMIPHPERGYYDVHVQGAARIVDQALHRIRQASTKYGLSPNQRNRLTAAFIAGSTHRFP
jgi:hypothetical protein